MSVVMLLVVVGAWCWGADNQSAWHAAATAFPAAPEQVQAALVRLLVSLGDGGRISVTYMNKTVGFVVKGETVLIESSPAAGTSGPVAGAKAWERPGKKAGEEIIGPDGGKMVWVPPGEFMMGSTPAEQDYAFGLAKKESEGAKREEFAPEGPAHKVRITKGFWLGKYTVTNTQYRAFCEATKRDPPVGGMHGKGPYHPMVDVKWEDAKAYCDYYGLALPTEAQWEYAARGPQSLRYPWGNDWDPKKCWNGENKGSDDPATMEVGSLPAGDSWCGASDMAGNVSQWCADWYYEGYYAKSPPADPTGPPSWEERVYRGGSWKGDPVSCRSAARESGNPTFPAGDDSGFRCVRTP